MMVSSILCMSLKFIVGFVGLTTASLADGLPHAVQNGTIDPSRATPELAEKIIHDKSWVYLTIQNNGRTLPPLTSQAFSSPVDLCEFITTRSNGTDITYQDWQNNEDVQRCIGQATEIAAAELRCFVDSDDETSSLDIVSDEKVPTFWAVMAHVDWGRAIALLVAAIVLTYKKIGTTRQKNQYVTIVLYWALMTLVMRFTMPEAKSTFSTFSVLDIVKQSFEAFAYVHPMESPLVALSHFASYWTYIASWRSKSLRNFLLWNVLLELGTVVINEYTHLLEEQDIVHCTRVAFKGSMHENAFDNMIRGYVLPPFFTYGYLLPKFILYWTMEKPFLCLRIIAIASFVICCTSKWANTNMTKTTKRD